ncbi:MAG TPA: hypothetical protein VHK27_00230, partial [Gammaproteobacteria bacterium]|nr:hypothetical protein [Gammaproteobacteria bacterium]
DEFIERHSAEAKELKEIPRAQLKAIKPTLERIFAKNRESGIVEALPGAWVSAARDRRALRSPLRNGKPKT